MKNAGTLLFYVLLLSVLVLIVRKFLKNKEDKNEIVVSSRDTKNLHPVLLSGFEKAKESYLKKYPGKPVPFITQVHRSMKDQQTAYNQGRTTPGAKITNAKPGESPHNYLPSLAFDLSFMTAEKKLDWNENYFKNFADLIKGVDSQITWGGDWKGFKDTPHFELKNWKQYIKK